MSKRATLLALTAILILSLAGCGSEPTAQPEKKAAAPAEAPKKEEPPPAVYELTKESLTDHPDWTSRNVSILGAKIGDKTTSVQNNFGKLDNTRTLADDYLTIYQNNGLFVYTQKLTGKLRKFEVYETFAKQLADDKLKKLLATGDLKYMREILGPEEKTEENADDQSTEYAYDARGFRFVKFKVSGKTVNALRFSEIKKTVS
jgi:predicted small lipoprotein YifL